LSKDAIALEMVSAIARIISNEVDVEFVEDDAIFDEAKIAWS